MNKIKTSLNSFGDIFKIISFGLREKKWVKLSAIVSASILTHMYIPEVSQIALSVMAGGMYFTNNFPSNSLLKKKFNFDLTKPKLPFKITKEDIVNTTIGLLPVGYLLAKKSTSMTEHYSADPLRLIASTAYTTFLTKQVFSLTKDFVAPTIKPAFRDLKSYVYRLIGEFTKNTSLLKSDKAKIYDSVSVDIIHNIADKNYIEGLGTELKYASFKDEFNEVSELSKFQKYLFYAQAFYGNVDNIYLFAQGFPLPIPEEIKEHYGSLALEDVLDKKDLNDVKKLNLVAAIAKYFDTRDKNYAKYAWGKYEDLRNKTNLTSVIAAGGTQGTSFQPNDEDYENAPEDEVVMNRVMDNYEELNKESLYAKYLFKTFENNEIVTFPRVVGKGNIKEKSYYSVVKSWMPTIAEYIRLKNPSVEDINVIMQHCLRSIDIINDTVGESFEIEGNKFIIQRADLKKNYLSENKLLHPDSKIFDPILAEEIIDYVIKSKHTAWKIFQDFFIDNGHIPYFYTPDSVMFKKDNNFPVLVPELFDKINLATYHNGEIPLESQDKILKFYKQNMLNDLILNRIVRGWSRIRGLSNEEEPNIQNIRNFAKQEYDFFEREKHNLTGDIYSIVNNSMNQMKMLGMNLTEICDYQHSKKSF